MNSFQDPSIYNLLIVEESKEKRPPRYKSKFQRSVRDEYEAGIEGNKTMGPAKMCPPRPQNHLIKHGKEPLLAQKQSFHYPDEERKKPAVPKNGDLPLMGLRTTENIMCANAVKNVLSLPKIPAKRYVDTRRGDAHDLLQSGCEPVYVHKKEYGEVPVYITRRKEELTRAKDEYDKYVAEKFQAGAMRQLTDLEHQTILEGLKTNWEDLLDRYQSLSVVTDTLGRKYRKERMENQLKQLERDIELLEKHKIVYVEN
ncbi:unnamed protein product [Candidula unifasciata]|uniref:Enkurin domain-containing protein n=1 Tax=Candidula unifasciata TaxID=100452 RepID=A0A8S3ZVD3_9EUPU|nr:unnamed protein product [Candidula unifasciata]